MKQKLTLLTACIFCSMMSYAQIGYQVSLLNSATGEPRANETVSVSVSITNSEDAQIFSSTQSATTNDFGVLSLQIGNSTTFDNVDWSKLPLFISATVDGVMVGKSQILNVPVAEAAKQLIGIPLDELIGSWSGTDGGHTRTIILDNAFNCTIIKNNYVEYATHGIYFVQGNLLCLCIYEEDGIYSELMMYNQGYLYSTSSNYSYSFRLSKD